MDIGADASGLVCTSDKPATAQEYRKIKVTVKDKTFVVQNRDGYYVGK